MRALLRPEISYPSPGGGDQHLDPAVARELRIAETPGLHRAHGAPSASNNASRSDSPHESAMTTTRRAPPLPK